METPQLVTTIDKLLSTLLSVPSKILGKIIEGRIREGIDRLLREKQAGFRRGRGTT